ncbi:MAG: Secretion system C-terminal sorting domain [Bacteroidota bacterium]|jgi:hypothetical protein
MYKKIISLFCCLVLMQTLTLAQAFPQIPYEPMVKEGANWVINIVGFDTGRPYYAGNACFRIKGDTLIQNQAYKKCYQFGLYSSDSILVVLLREDTTMRRVYAKRPASVIRSGLFYLSLNTCPTDSSFILFDFNTTAGYQADFCYRPLQTPSLPLTVRIDTINIFGKTRRRFSYSGGNFSTSMIEGVGYASGAYVNGYTGGMFFVYGGYWGGGIIPRPSPGEFNYHITHHSVQPSWTIDSLRRYVSTNDLPDAVSKIIVYPNPTADQLHLAWEQPLAQAGACEIYDVSGRKVVANALPSGALAHTVDVSNYATGLYFYRIRLENAQTVGKFVIKR